MTQDLGSQRVYPPGVPFPPRIKMRLPRRPHFITRDAGTMADMCGGVAPKLKEDEWVAMLCLAFEGVPYWRTHVSFWDL